MKFLLGIFFAAFAFASAAPLDASSNDLTTRDLEDFLTGLAFATEEDGRIEDGQNQLKERLEKILEEIKIALDDGKAVKEELIAKMKEIREKLKGELGDKAKELLERIKESGRDYLKKILNKLGLSKRDIEERTEAILEAEKTSLEDVQKQLKERLDEVLKKIKDAIDQGKSVKEDMLKKMKELRQKMKDMNLELGKKSKDILERIKEKGRDFLKEILEKLGFDRNSAEEQADAILLLTENDSNQIEVLKEKLRNLIDHVKESLEGSKSFEGILEKFLDFQTYLKTLKVDLGDDGKEFIETIKGKLKNYWKNLKEKFGKKRSADIDIFGMIDQIKELVKEKFNADKLKQIVEKYLGKGSEAVEQLMNALKEKGEKRKQKILEWIDRIFNQDRQDRSIKDAFEKIKTYFKDLGIELKEKYFRFGEWVKTQYGKGLEKGKDKIDNVKKIAKEFLDDTKEMSKGVAREALNFFREYEQDLGNVFNDLKKKVKDIMDKE